MLWKLIVLLWSIDVISACCPSGWVVHEMSCYLFSRDNARFLDAEDQCARLHGHLVNVGTQSENTFLQSFATGLKDNNYLIGLNDLVREGEWQWYDTDMRTTLTDWAPRQPGISVNSNCVVMSAASAYKWNDISCSQPSNYICELPIEASNIGGIVG